MLPELEALLRLNEVDAEIFNLRQANQSLPVRLQELTQAVETAEREFQTVQETLTNLTKDKSSMEIQLQEFQGQSEKSQKKLENIKTNKEYDAVHQELASLKQQQGHTETRVLENLEQTDLAQKLLVEKQETHKKLVEASTAEIEKCRTELSGLETKIQERAKEREKYLPQITGRFLSAYNRLRTHARRASCLGLVYDIPDRPFCSYCSITLPPQVFNIVKRNSALTTCENCGAILVLQTGTPPAFLQTKTPAKKQQP